MMDAVKHFLEMGGYARFVWPAYGVGLLVLGSFLATSISAYRRVQRELASIEAQRGGQAQRRGGRR